MKRRCNHLPQYHGVSLGPPAGAVAVLQMKDTPSWEKVERHGDCFTQDCEEKKKV